MRYFLVTGVALTMFATAALIPQSACASDPGVQEKGGLDLTGPYDVVVGWFKPGIEGWNQRVVSVNAEDPNRVFIGAVGSGLYVTDMIGMGINMVTGDYSRGANGFWIEKGKLTFPVSEITIAGNLKDMFGQLTPANDLVFRYGVDAPTLRIDGMTLAGA